MARTPYEVLGVSPTASIDEIKGAYRTLARKNHPDLNPGNKEAEKKIKEINSAYELVGTEDARAKFDRGETEAESMRGDPRARPRSYRETQENGGRYSGNFGGGEFDEDFFSTIFGGRGGGGGGGGPRRPTDFPGQDETYRMDIDFHDAILGGEREITLPTGKRLRVKIPPGIESGKRLRFGGLGGAGHGKGAPGDAYVEIQVRPSSTFRRMGDDLEIEMPISFAEAILGGEIRTPTIDGAVHLKIPTGVSAGARLRVAGKGVPTANGKRGDQYVVLRIVMPTAPIDDELRMAVEAWTKRQTFDPRANWAGGEARKGSA